MRPLPAPRLTLLLAGPGLLLTVSGCGSVSSEARFEDLDLMGARDEPSPTVEAAPPEAEEELQDKRADEGKVGRRNAKPKAPARGPGGGGAKNLVSENLLAMGYATNSPEEPSKPDDVAGRDQGEGPATEVTRSWFPQTFLWQPLVETGPEGTTTVDLRVPDQLTTWRILALAHDRAGHQAGSVHTFDSTLPVYLDPVVPGWMYRGDTFQIPLMVQNNSADAVTSTLSASADGAATGNANSPVALEPWRSQIVPMTVVADAAGEAKVKARLQGFDAIERAVRVLPVGRPLERVRGGVLSGPRDLTIAGPEGTDPATERLDVLVFAGPLSVLQAEIERLGGGTAWDGPYGLALAGQVASVAARTGATVDDKAIRRLELQSWQRFLRSARAPRRRPGRRPPRRPRPAHQVRRVQAHPEPPRRCRRPEPARRRHLVQELLLDPPAGPRRDRLVRPRPPRRPGRRKAPRRRRLRAQPRPGPRPLHRRRPPLHRPHPG